MSMKPQAVANMQRYYGWTYKVYLLTFPDGKIYVGQTELDVTKRWRGGLGYKDNDDFIFEIKESVYVTTDMVDMGDIDVCYDEFE